MKSKTLGWTVSLGFFLWAHNFGSAFASSANPEVNITIFSVVALVGGIALFFWGFRELKKKRVVEDIPTSKIHAMAPGMVELEGKASDWNLVTSPFTQQPCVYYEYEVEKYVSSGKNSSWETIKSGKTEYHPFCLEDETGKVGVIPEKAQVIIDDPWVLTTSSFSDIPPHIDAFLNANGVSCNYFLGMHPELRFTERLFLPGESLFVLGNCQGLEKRGFQPPEGAVKETCVAKGEGPGEFFILSDESQKKLASSFGWHAFVGVFFGVAFIGGGVYGLLFIWKPF